MHLYRPALLLPLLALAACSGAEEKDDPATDDTDLNTDDTGADPDDTGGDPDDTGGDPDDTGTDPAGDAQIRVLHLSPDAPAVDVYADGSAAVEGLAFPDGTGYLTVPAGTYTFDVAPAGAGVGASVLQIPGVALEEGKAYTAVAYGRVAQIAALALPDDAGGLASDRVRLTVAHTAAAVGEVDIWEISGESPVELLADVPFGAAATLPDLPVGALRIGLDVDDDARPDVVFDVPELPGGTQANVFAVTDAADQPFLLAQLPDGATVRIDPTPIAPPAQIRVLHLSPDAPAVDVFVNGAADPVVTALPFLSGTGYLGVPAGIYTFDAAPTGAGIGASVLQIPNLPLDAGLSYSAVAYGRLDSLAAMALVDDATGLAPDQIRVQVAHAAAAVGEVDIWSLDLGVPLLSDVPYGAAATLADLPAGAYRVGIDVNNDAMADLTFSLPAIGGGTFVNLFAVSDATDAVWLVAWLPDGTVVPIAADPM
jgi:hypothetical protein